MKFSALWPAGLALVAVILLAGLDLPFSRSHRVTNVDLEGTGFPDTYIMLSKTDAGRAYVVNRRDATMRRSDDRQPGDKWEVAQIPSPYAEDGLASWLIRSKRKGKGTVLFVPVDDVQDWTYPFCYTFVRKQRKDLKLPRVEWTQLFVNRVYQGLYLRVALPFDRRKKDGGSGILREILTVRGNQLTQINTRFDDPRGVYSDQLADGIFPRLETPPAILAWLARRSPTRGTVLLLSNVPPYGLTLLPLPIDLPELFEAKNGRPPAGFSDDRYGEWSQGAWRGAGSNEDGFSDEARAAMKAQFAEYADSLRRALIVHATVHQTLPELRNVLDDRQSATSDLRLSLRGL